MSRKNCGQLSRSIRSTCVGRSRGARGKGKASHNVKEKKQKKKRKKKQKKKEQPQLSPKKQAKQSKVANAALRPTPTVRQEERLASGRRRREADA